MDHIYPKTASCSLCITNYHNYYLDYQAILKHTVAAYYYETSCTLSGLFFYRAMVYLVYMHRFDPMKCMYTLIVLFKIIGTAIGRVEGSKKMIFP